MLNINNKNIVKINEWLWEIEKTYRGDMLVPARIYASQDMLNDIFKDNSVEQLINVSTLPGIKKYAIAMPDIHEGYGFPIGGVAAFDINEGIISPGGIGYDINCGVRLLKSKVDYESIKNYLPELGRKIYQEVPSGVGREGKLKLTNKELDRILEGGAERIIKIGYGEKADLNHIESQGKLDKANPELVSDKAKNRGRGQLGTMGAGNHFVEIDTVSDIFNKGEAEKLGIFKGQIVILIHTGSRGLGHQIATDYIRTMIQSMHKYNIKIPDRELACSPFNSKEGMSYFYAMSCGANFAWANRQLITWEIRKAWKNVLGSSAENLEVVYDIAHNIAKIEEHFVDYGNRNKQKVLVHRKGATRSFPGQPVIIPGSMGTSSYLLVGKKESMIKSFGSTCHGAGRKMSRTQARKQIYGEELKYNLEKQGISINSGSIRGLSEEAPEAYKDIDDVVNVVSRAGIAEKVAKLKPISVIKG